jgi:NADH-quinone oxidoreductase subunit C
MFRGIKLFNIIKKKCIFLNKNFYFFKKIKIFIYFFYINLYKFFNTIGIIYDYIFFFINKSNIWLFSFFLKNFILFGNSIQLIDFTIVDKLNLIKKYRFEYLYVFISIFYNIRILIKGVLQLFDSINSLMHLFSSSNWLEREVWDLFGIFFLGHTNLRRILTDYSFIGYPLRKDYPLSGYLELRYDDIHKNIIFDSIELLQEFRFFNLDIPWVF